MSIPPILGLLPPIPPGVIQAHYGLDKFGAKSSFSVRANDIFIEVVTRTHHAIFT